MKICVTGHRPNKLYGYNLSDIRWQKLKEQFKTILVENDCTEAITGMALGVDTVFALAVLELKSDGYDIKLHCAIPCKNHSCKWIKESVDQYNNILEKADIVKLVSDEEYKPWLMQKRNEYMVNLLTSDNDFLIALWDGTPGGTANCIRYAKKLNKRIIYINPNSLNN